MKYIFHFSLFIVKHKSVIRLWEDCPLMLCGLLFGLLKA